MDVGDQVTAVAVELDQARDADCSSVSAKLERSALPEAALPSYVEVLRWLGRLCDRAARRCQLAATDVAEEFTPFGAETHGIFNESLLLPST